MAFSMHALFKKVATSFEKEPLFSQKVTFFIFFLPNYLHSSKKSSNFAVDFDV